MGHERVIVHLLNQCLRPLGGELRRAESGPLRAELPRLRAFAAVSLVGLPGAIVECGVGSGDSLRLLGWLHPECQLIGYDSFAGFPEPSLEDTGAGERGRWRVSQRAVSRRLQRAGIPAELRPGWFRDTLLGHTEPIALLHVDADLYDSTLTALMCLWPWVVPGGTVIIDDYETPKWPGVTTAVHEFVAKQTEPLAIRHLGLGLLGIARV